MKRALLIAGGTVGGLGAVLAITPPQFTSSQTLNVAGAGLSNPSGNSATTAAPASTPTSATTSNQQSAVATKAATKKAAVATQSGVKSAKNNSSAAVTTSAAQDTTQSQTPTPAAPPPTQTATPTPTAKGVSGTFTGPVVNVSYGNVQVQITVSNGKITDAQALVAPTGKNDRYTSFSVPVLRKQTLAAQSDAIQGASGASYTSYGWYKSLQGALSKAGL
jgi:uncharacterized protein with FMN-binding domain